MFNCEETLLKLKNQTKSIRKKTYKTRESKLDLYTFELLELKKNGASYSELQRFLRGNRIKVALSTVTRYMRKIENGHFQKNSNSRATS